MKYTWDDYEADKRSNELKRTDPALWARMAERHDDLNLGTEGPTTKQ